MKRTYLILLELAIIWVEVLSGPNELFRPDRRGNVPWAVTVKSLPGRSYDEKLLVNQQESVKKAFKEVLCAGVIIDRILCFVPGICVNGIEPKDLRVFHKTTGSTYNVTAIEFWGSNYGAEYALLVLSKPIKNGTTLVPFIGQSDEAHPFNCYVSDFWNSTRRAKVPRRGKFYRIPHNECFEDGVFIGSDPNPGHGLAMMKYASPLVCEDRKQEKLMVVGYYAWPFPMNSSAGYMCCTNKTMLMASSKITVHHVGVKNVSPKPSPVKFVVHFNVPPAPGFIQRIVMTIDMEYDHAKP